MGIVPMAWRVWRQPGQLRRVFLEHWKRAYDEVKTLALLFGMVGAGVGYVVFRGARPWVGRIFGAIALVLLGWTVWCALRAVLRVGAADLPLMPPERTVRFKAVAYAASSDRDQRELSRLALEKFGETFAEAVDLGAVRKGCALGLRLTSEDGRNLGFLDAYSLSADALREWLNGELAEADMTLDHFQPIARPSERAGRDIELVLGALLIDTSRAFTDYRLAGLFIDAARDYFEEQCYGFKRIRLYATIFSQAGERWAKNAGFERFIAGAMRGSKGGGHDVFVLTLAPSRHVTREVYRAFHRDFEYRLEVRTA